MMHLHRFRYDTKRFISFLDFIEDNFLIAFSLRTTHFPRYLEKHWMCIPVSVHTYRHGLMCLCMCM